MGPTMQDKSPLEITDKIFYEDNDFDLTKVQSLLSTTLENAGVKVMPSFVISTSPWEPRDQAPIRYRVLLDPGLIISCVIRRTFLQINRDSNLSTKSLFYNFIKRF